MSVAVVFNGTTYSIPSPGQTGWADSLNAFLVALGTALGTRGGAMTASNTLSTQTLSISGGLQANGLTVKGGTSIGRGLILPNNNSVNAPLQVIGTAQPSGPNAVGDLYMTTAGVLKVCTIAGTPGTFVSVGAQT